MKDKPLKSLLEYLISFLLLYLCGSILFIALFHTPLFQQINVFMYRGILLLLLSSLICIILGIVIRKKLFASLTGKDIFSIYCMYLCLQLMFFTLVPVTVERSISVFMLTYMDTTHEPLTQDELAAAFNEQYLEEDSALLLVEHCM